MRTRWIVQSKAVRRVGLVLIAVSLIVTACSNELNAVPEPSPTPSPQAVATRLTALLIGELVMADGCLRVNDGADDNGYLLVWPPEQHEVSIEGDTVRIVDRLRGKAVVWHIGEIARLGGGEVDPAFLDERTRQNLPEKCPGPYWLVGDVDLSERP